MAYNILIVDDSATMRAMIRRIVKMAGIPVGELYEAGDGLAALGILATSKVDLVLADLNMPGMTGVEMTHEMRQDAQLREIPVIVISAEPNIDRLEQLKKDGVQAYVRKPFTPEAVRDVVNKVMGDAVHA